VRRRLRRSALAASVGALALVLGGGCTYSVSRAGDGRFLDAPLDWRPGVTTALEVAQALGPPDYLRQTGPRTTFIYRFRRRAEAHFALSFYLKLFQRDEEREVDGTLLVAFDADDRLLYHGRSELPAEDLAADLGLR